MTIQIDTGCTDTPIEGVTSLTFPRGLLNFKEDFRVKSNTGKDVVLTNTTADWDRPELVRLAFTEVANIYNGTNVEVPYAAPTKRGVSVLAQVTEILSVSDSTDPQFRIDLPVSAHLVIKAPMSQYLTAAQLQTLVGRLLSSLFDTGVATTSRLEAIMRGSLVPLDL